MPDKTIAKELNRAVFSEWLGNCLSTLKENLAVAVEGKMDATMLRDCLDLVEERRWLYGLSQRLKGNPIYLNVYVGMDRNEHKGIVALRWQSEYARGIIIDDQAAIAQITELSLIAIRDRIAAIETELTAKGIEFEPLPIPGSKTDAG